MAHNHDFTKLCGADCPESRTVTTTSANEGPAEGAQEDRSFEMGSTGETEPFGSKGRPETQRGWYDGPHSRACGVRVHSHGIDCHTNCPTCRGVPKDIGVRPETGVAVNSHLGEETPEWKLAPGDLVVLPDQLPESEQMLHEVLNTLEEIKSLKDKQSSTRRIHALAMTAAVQLELVDTLRGVEADQRDNHMRVLEGFGAEVERLFSQVGGEITVSQFYQRVGTLLQAMGVLRP